jgi:hypothetical protein
MIDSSRIEKAREFVRKFNNDEFDYPEKLTEDQQDTLDHLSGAKADFEKADEEMSNWKEPPRGLIDPDIVSLNRRTLNYNFETALKSLHRWMSLAKVNKLYSDHGLKKQVDDYKKKRVELENQIKNLKSHNTQLVEDKIKLDIVLKDIFKNLPAVKNKYKKDLPKEYFDDDDDPPESEITNG